MQHFILILTSEIGHAYLQQHSKIQNKSEKNHCIYLNSYLFELIFICLPQFK